MTRSGQAADRVVVAGGGIAGLLAAAAAAAAAAEVVVIDPGGPSDQLGGHPPRAQLHNVLSRGQRHLEELLPGFRDRFLAAGGAEGDVCLDTHVYEFGGDAYRRSVGLVIWSAPWQLIWDTACALLPPNVEIRHRTTVEDLDVDGGSVRAVRLVGDGRNEMSDVAALVDASGHGSRLTSRLAAIGGAVPRVEVQRLDRWFITIRLLRPPAMVGHQDFWMTFCDPPNRQVALMSPLGPDMWDLSIESQERNSGPPVDFAGILSFLDALPGPPLRPVVEQATPIGRPWLFRRREARWRHYEEVERPVSGFIPVGDAFVSTNPVHGQGIGISAWQASILREALAVREHDGSWTASYLEAAGRVARQAWDLDLVPIPAISLSDWIALGQGMTADIDIHRRYVGIWHLIEPASSLPDLVKAARQGAAARTGGPT